jgi:hypothetical protein
MQIDKHFLHVTKISGLYLSIYQCTLITRIVLDEKTYQRSRVPNSKGQSGSSVTARQGRQHGARARADANEPKIVLTFLVWIAKFRHLR